MPGLAMIARDVLDQIEITTTQFPPGDCSLADILIAGMGLAPEEIEPLIDLVLKRMYGRCAFDPDLAGNMDVALDGAMQGWVDGFVTGYNLAKRGL